MFKPLDKNIEDRVRTSGALSIEVITRGIGYDNCNITYNRKVFGTEVILRRLFTCALSRTQHSMLIWEINRYEGTTIQPDESEQFLFLQMLIESFERWAVEAGLHSISLSSNLSHIPELMVDNGFTLKVMEFIPGVKTYSGTKILTNTIKEGKDEGS